MKHLTVGKALLLLITLWPPVYLFYTGFFIYDRLVAALLAVADLEAAGSLTALFYLHSATLFVWMATFVFYAAHAYRNPRVPEKRKGVWLVVFVVLTSLAFLAYWWKYVLPVGGEGGFQTRPYNGGAAGRVG